MLRVALACCQVTSPNTSQKDGFAKLITKSDFLPFGKFQVRLTLWLLDKELKGREEKKYETMEKIKELFESDLTACTVAQQAFPAASSSAAAPSGASVAVKELGMASDPKTIALSQHRHIKVNGLYVYKGSTKVYTLQEMTDHAAKLYHEPYLGSKEDLEVKLGDLKFLKEWKKAKPTLIADDIQEELLPSKSKLLEQELAIAQAQVELYSKYKECPG